MCSRNTFPSLKELKKILQEGVDINFTNGKGLTPLLCLTAEKKIGHDNLIEIFQLLIQHKIDVNYKDNAGWNALITLCRYYQNENLIEIIKILIRHGIDVNCKINGGWNAVSLLCRYNQNENLIEILRLLTEHGCKVTQFASNQLYNNLQVKPEKRMKILHFLLYKSH